MPLRKIWIHIQKNLSVFPSVSKVLTYQKLARLALCNFDTVEEIWENLIYCKSVG